MPVDALDVQSKLATAREAKAKRDEAKRLEAEARELEALELEAKYEAELGPRGVAFEIVETAVANIVVKRGEFVVYKRFLAIPDGKRGDEDVSALVTPYVVHPEKATYLALTKDHFGIAWLCCKAMLEMYEARKGEKAGK